MKRGLKRWLITALLRLADRPRAGDIAALTYHSIDESGSPISFPASHFRSQIEWLASAGYRSLTTSEAAAVLSRRRQATAPGVVLTFDDGFRSVNEVALPILSEYGFVATVFCAAGYAGKQSAWDGAPGVPALPMMSWDELAFLASQGWEIGAHTMWHACLPGLPPGRMQEEIADSRRILQERIRSEVGSFAYPFGRYDELCAETVAAAGFTSAWTMRPRPNRPGCDPFSLGRFNCDRIQSEDAYMAVLAARTYLGGCYPYYAFLTARSLRVGAPAREER